MIVGEATATVAVSQQEVFDFKAPWDLIAEPLLRRWLEPDTGEEMVRFKELVEGDAGPIPT